MIHFEIGIDPIPQPRPKARRIGPGIQIYTPNSGPIKLYKAAIVEAFKQVAGEAFEPLKGPITLSIGFVFERPYARLKENDHIIKPDLDNLAKGIMDALNGTAWHDDSQITTLCLTKDWAPTYLGGKSGRKLESKGSCISVTIRDSDTAWVLVL